MFFLRFFFLLKLSFAVRKFAVITVVPFTIFGLFIVLVWISDYDILVLYAIEAILYKVDSFKAGTFQNIPTENTVSMSMKLV